MSTPATPDEDPWASFEAAFSDTPEVPPANPAGAETASLRNVDRFSTNSSPSSDPEPDPRVPPPVGDDLSEMMSHLEGLLPSGAVSPPNIPPLPSPELAQGVNSRLGTMTHAQLPQVAIPAPQILPPILAHRPVTSTPLVQPPLSLLATNGPLRLEYRGSSSLKVNHRAVVAIRLQSMRGESCCEVLVKSSLMDAPQSFSIECPAPGYYEITTLRLAPREAGDHDLRFELTVTDNQGIPRSRLTGNLILAVAPERESQTIQAGGDVIMLGGATPLSALGASSPSLQDSWQMIPMIEDPAMADRVRRMIPAARLPRPARNQQVPQNLATSGVLYAGTGAGFVCYMISVGQSASIGRGGTNETTWWVTPVPERGQSSRLSRRHLSLEFREQYAWIQDHSANGVTLNGRKMTRDRAEVVAHRDRFDMAGALQFTVELDSDDRMIESLQLIRSDDLSQKLRCVLVRPGASFAVEMAGAAAWVTVLTRDTIHVEVAGKTQTLRTGEECSLDSDRRLAWHQMEGPVDQLQIL